jgi:hypothetical protein
MSIENGTTKFLLIALHICKIVLEDIYVTPSVSQQALACLAKLQRRKRCATVSFFGGCKDHAYENPIPYPYFPEYL